VFNAEGYVLKSANGISPDGQYIVGTAHSNWGNKDEAFMVSPEFLYIPEPASMGLLAGATLLLMRRRQAARPRRFCRR